MGGRGHRWRVGGWRRRRERWRGRWRGRPRRGEAVVGWVGGGERGGGDSCGEVRRWVWDIGTQDKTLVGA